MARRSKLSLTAQKNIESIAKVEQQLLKRRPLLVRVGDAVAHFFGSVWFIAAQIPLLCLWMLWNLPREKLAAIPVIEGFVRPLIHLDRPHRLFDPYPFPLLSLLIDIEFLLLTTFVLMNQKHAGRRNEHWAHLHLQLSMLTEQEVTKNLQLLDRVCRHLGCGAEAEDPQLLELSQPKKVADMIKALNRSRAAVGDAPSLKTVREIERKDLAPGREEAK